LQAVQGGKFERLFRIDRHVVFSQPVRRLGSNESFTGLSLDSLAKDGKHTCRHGNVK
jgi:hypothetical protein